MLIGCPLELIPADAWEALEVARRFRDHGILPVAGGWLDQTAVFVDVIETVEAERRQFIAEIEAQRGK